MFTKLLVANRGEIAVRVIRACREMGISPVAVYSEADAKSLHVRMADEAVCVGGARSEESYLKYSEIVPAALACGCQAVHPGYGFLSENAEFAQMCRTCNLVFVGPSPDVISRTGDKAAARRVVAGADVPVPRGSSSPLSSLEEAIRVAEKVGFPLLIKPVGGGGGKGMRVVTGKDELAEVFERSQAEAKAAFARGDVYVERLIPQPRHIEFQIVADRHGNVVHLGERECSVQRRHQKLIEESPSCALDRSLRKRMGKSAIAAARAVGYDSVGTVEFLLDADGKYYFIEMNSRIQVEHPVTECVTGIDLVKEQIRIAAGHAVRPEVGDCIMRGHAIECRVNAEDPAAGFAPCPGRIRGVGLPGGPGVRVDTHIFHGYVVPHYYDSLLAKVIAYGENRSEALARMVRALREFTVLGVKTTAPFLLEVLNTPEFKSGNYTTEMVTRMLGSGTTAGAVTGSGGNDDAERSGRESGVE